MEVVGSLGEKVKDAQVVGINVQEMANEVVLQQVSLVLRRKKIPRHLGTRH